ncbi:MAG: ADP-ribose pyrophosphatase [Actinobacteria bacterium HGW-Actinobacteria-4]|nr:MAG: ADP-ribose pyrophosphatase [Actinobacteria bacterium HGW-Actinobacteria-4]
MTHLEPLADVYAPRPVLSSEKSFGGRVWDVTTDVVDLGDAGTVTRDYVAHTGAVAVMAMNGAGQVYLVRQYRHPVQRELWEPPAGLLDEPGESPLDAAKRELWEEADLVADTWNVLIDFATSPGGNSEGIRIYLARDVSDAPDDGRHVREAEEQDMPGEWVELDAILAAAHEGRIWGPTTIVGAFALDAARRSGWALVRPAEAPWHYTPGRG